MILLSVISLLILLESIFPLLKVSLKKRALHGLTNLIFFSLSRIIFIFATSFVITYFLKNEESSFREIIFSIFILDFFLWVQHVASHKFRVLWRLHEVHHSDEYLDLTSALRFHPFELILSYFYKILIIMLFNISIEAFLFSEMIIAIFALFNHSNLSLGKKVDKIVSTIFVTPNFHQVHHSDKSQEMNNNFGTIFVFWDKLSKKYTSYYSLQSDFKIGLKYINEKQSRSLIQLFLLPFRKVKQL